MTGTASLPAAGRDTQNPQERTLRALILEDNPGDARLIEEYLLEGAPGALVEADHSASLGDAFARLERRNYDVILVDYRLGGEDGLTFLRDVRFRGLETPAIVLTGMGGEEVAVEAMKAGAVDYLQKSSLSPDTLASAVRYAVELQRARLLRERSEEARLQLAAIGGIPYETEMNIKMGGSGPMAGLLAKMGNMSMTQTVQSVETETLTDDLFAPPAGYKLNPKK